MEGPNLVDVVKACNQEEVEVLEVGVLDQVDRESARARAKNAKKPRNKNKNPGGFLSVPTNWSTRPSVSPPMRDFFQGKRVKKSALVLQKCQIEAKKGPIMLMLRG